MKETRIHLMTPIQIGRMTNEELIKYIDQLHSIIMEYQIVINVAIDKNQNIRV